MKTKYWSLWLAVSKKNFIDKASIINLKKPKTLDILFSKFKLKSKLTKNEIHKRTKATKNLFLKILKFFSFKQNTIKIKQTNKVFKLINRLPIKKHIGNTEIIAPNIIINWLSLNLVFILWNFMFDYYN